MFNTIYLLRNNSQIYLTLTYYVETLPETVIVKMYMLKQTQADTGVGSQLKISRDFSALTYLADFLLSTFCIVMQCDEVLVRQPLCTTLPGLIPRHNIHFIRTSSYKAVEIIRDVTVLCPHLFTQQLTLDFKYLVVQ